MASYHLLSLLIIAALAVNDADAGRRSRRSWRKQPSFYPIDVASRLCRIIRGYGNACSECNCNAPVSVFCKKACAIREHVRKCAQDVLCPPLESTTTQTTPAETTTVTETTTETTPETTTDMQCTSNCIPEPGSNCLAFDEEGTCPAGQICCGLVQFK